MTAAVSARTDSGTGPPVASNQRSAMSRASSSCRFIRAAQPSGSFSNSTISSRLRSRWELQRP